MSVDPIVARAQEAISATLESVIKEAYHAGREDASGTIKTRILGLFEELFGMPAPSGTAASDNPHSPAAIEAAIEHLADEAAVSDAPATSEGHAEPAATPAETSTHDSATSWQGGFTHAVEQVGDAVQSFQGHSEGQGYNHGS